MLQHYNVIVHETGEKVEFFESPAKIYNRLEETIYILCEYDVDIKALKAELPKGERVTLSKNRADMAQIYQQGNIFHIYPIA